jgi:hypothetical protein
MSTQTPANAGASGQFKPADLVVPTTRMLAIGRLTEAGKSAARFPIMPSEVRETIRLHLTGKIDQWFFQTEGGGVVFIMNVTERAEACELLEALPLGQAGMMAFELIPLGPLKPLAVLLGETSRHRMESGPFPIRAVREAKWNRGARPIFAICDISRW